MYVVPPNDTWPPGTVPQSRALVLRTILGIPMVLVPPRPSAVVDEALAILRAPPGIVIPRVGALTARSIAEGSDPLGSEFGVGRHVFAEYARARAAERAADSVDALHYAVGELMGSAMARRMDTMILSYFTYMPATAEAMAALYRSMGIEMPSGQQLPLLSSGGIILAAKTLRQRCFGRLFNGFNKETGVIRLMYAGTPGFKIEPFTDTLRSLMPACYRNKRLRKALSALPIMTGTQGVRSNPELVEPLQDLANIIAYEIRLAYEDEYYPGVTDVAPLTDEHVDRVMVAMQREIDREKRYVDDESRLKITAHLPDLPRERKTALAEKRRHWFGVFGITPASWKKGTWSLWKVKNVPYPDGYKEPVW